jgi:poly(A) polymerase
MSTIPSLQAHEMLATSGLPAVFDAIAAAGGEARIVGGAVRNALLGEPVQDIDIATNLLPEQVVEAAQAAGLKAVPTGIDHGTVTLVSEGNGFEVTTLRHDMETDGRRATVAYTDDWAADAARRDFTLNALYCDSEGNVHDPLGGYANLLVRNIRFVGDPASRITEDYLRILRFFRFISRYGKGAPDAAALAACIDLKDGLKQLSRERVGQEFRKLLLAPRAGEAARLMNTAGVSKVLFGVDLNDAMICGVRACAEAVSTAADYVTLLAGALPPSSGELTDLLKLSNADARALSSLQEAMPPTPALRDNERKVVLYQTGVETWRRTVLLAWANARAMDDEGWQALYRLPDEWDIPKLPVTGADLLAEGLEAGPKVGETLRTLEDWWIAGGFVATRDELLGRVSA